MREEEYVGFEQELLLADDPEGVPKPDEQLYAEFMLLACQRRNQPAFDFLYQHSSGEQKVKALIQAFKQKNACAIEWLLAKNNLVFDSIEDSAELFSPIIAEHNIVILRILLALLSDNSKKKLVDILRSEIHSGLEFNIAQKNEAMVVLLLESGVRAAHLNLALSSPAPRIAAWLLIYGADLADSEQKLVVEYREQLTAEIKSIVERALSSENTDLMLRCRDFFSRIGLEAPIPNSILSQVFHQKSWSSLFWGGVAPSISEFRRLSCEINQFLPEYVLVTQDGHSFLQPS